MMIKDVSELSIYVQPLAYRFAFAFVAMGTRSFPPPGLYLRSRNDGKKMQVRILIRIAL